MTWSCKGAHHLGCGFSFAWPFLIKGDDILVTINEEERPFDGITAEKALESLGYSADRVAVEINEQILPKSEYKTTVLHDGDRVIIVSFVGGG